MNTFTCLTDEEAQPRLEMIRRLVAQPIPNTNRRSSSSMQPDSTSSTAATTTTMAAPSGSSNSNSNIDDLARANSFDSQDNDTWTDPHPAWIEGTSMMVGNKYHASRPTELRELGVSAVLNCASGGISRLPMDELQEAGIRYGFTNVRQDDYAYPILFDPTTGEATKHLQVAKALYADVIQEQKRKQTTTDGGGGGGRVLFFCVAGQNRSPTLAVAVLMLFGHKLETILQSLSQTRPFVLENKGFQRQLVELEAMLNGRHNKKMKLMSTAATATQTPPLQLSSSRSSFESYRSRSGKSDTGGDNDEMVYVYASSPLPSTETIDMVTDGGEASDFVEVELLIPGLCTMDVMIAKESTIGQVKDKVVTHANEFLLSFSKPKGSKIAKSWLVLAMFGYDDMYDFPLEKEAIEESVQLELMKKMFGLEVFFKERSTNKEPLVRWNSKCRFALVIFSVYKALKDGSGGHEAYQEPWTFVHEERPGAPATFLEYNLLTTHLRAWDFGTSILLEFVKCIVKRLAHHLSVFIFLQVTGEPYSSVKPIVFSFSPDPRDKRQFMRISTSANKPVQFHAPGEGNILGMGANAIVHRVELGQVFESTKSREPDFMDACPPEDRWDSAVKRHFSLNKMISFLENRSEAGLAKRIRMASSLNSDGRVVEFYGLGVGLASNSDNEHEYKFEAMLLSRYEEEFSTYTMKKFMEDYLVPLQRTSPEEREEIEALQTNFSLISVKVLLVSLLNAFRDLTLMGVQAFDFNHLSNVLVSRDHRLCRLIDIDGDSKGSIQLDDTAEYIRGSQASPQSSASSSSRKISMHKPSLEIDLNTVLPTLVEQLILGKGRGRAFVTNKRSEIWRAKPDKARDMIMEILLENFYPNIALQSEDESFKSEKHCHKVR